MGPYGEVTVAFNPSADCATLEGTARWVTGVSVSSLLRQFGEQLLLLRVCRNVLVGPEIELRIVRPSQPLIESLGFRSGLERQNVPADPPAPKPEVRPLSPLQVLHDGLPPKCGRFGH